MAKTLFSNAVTSRYDKYKPIIRHAVVGAHICITGCPWPFDFLVIKNIVTYFVADGNIEIGYNNFFITIVQWQVQQNYYHI